MIGMMTEVEMIDSSLAQKALSQSDRIEDILKD